jgi:hypothetical protein
MSIRVTVASADLPNLATTIREVVEDTWKPYELTFDWLDDGEVSWDHVHVWIAAISDMPTSFDGGNMGQVLFHKGAPLPLIRISISAAVAWVLRYESNRFDTLTVFQ